MRFKVASSHFAVEYFIFSNYFYFITRLYDKIDRRILDIGREGREVIRLPGGGEMSGPRKNVRRS